jgi:Flp pilus assembly protein TadD
LNDRHSKVYNNLGIAFYNKGNVTEAKQAFIRARIIDPSSKEAIHNLDMLEKMIKQRDR